MPAADVLRHYDAASGGTAALHRAVSFEDVHRRLLHRLPKSPSSVLDVGSGAGRDALALAKMGHRVVAAEPSSGMLSAARAADPGHLVDWIDDGLPRLERVRSLGLEFDLVLCSAVLMHVASGELARSLRTMSGLLADGGFIAATVRAPRMDDPPGLFHHHRPAAMDEAATVAGLRVADRWRDLDALRGDRRWDGYVFERAVCLDRG